MCIINGMINHAVQQPHVLIAGTTGSGKSTVIQQMLYAILRSYDVPHSELWLLDPKKVELYPWINNPACTHYADEPKTMRDLLSLACRVMDDRYRTMRNQGITMTKEKPIYIVIDELADLLLASDRRIVKDTENSLSRIAQLGRAAQIHLIVATQFIRRSVLPESLIANITTVIGLRTRDALESKMIIGQSGCERLPKYGKAYYATPDIEDVCWYNIEKLSDEELAFTRAHTFRKTA